MVQETSCDFPPKSWSRDVGVRGILVYCADYRCSHSIAISGDHWPDDVRLSDIEPQFVCRRASSLETRPAQFLSVVVTDGLGAAG